MDATSPRIRLGIALCLLLASAGRAGAGFTIRDLGLLSPGGTSAGLAINATGQAAGFATDVSGSTTAVESTGGGPFQPLPVRNALSSFASGIDNSGNVVGSMVDASDASLHAFAILGDQFQKLGPLDVAGHPGVATQANGIAGGLIVGTGTIPGRVINGVYTPFPSATQTAFMGTNPQSLTVINPLGTGLANFGNGVNTLGVVVGTSEIRPNGPLHAFLATGDGTVTDLLRRNAPGSFLFNTEGNAINDRGDVVGDGAIGNREHAFFASHSGGGLVDLGLLGGASSIALGVNNLADPLVVGRVDYGTGDSRAFLWRSTEGMVDLRSLLSMSDQSSWSQLTQASGINDSNQIVGEGFLNGQLHGFLLTPVAGEPIFTPAGSIVPEPPALLMVTIGSVLAAGATRLRRRRASARRAGR